MTIQHAPSQLDIDLSAHTASRLTSSVTVIIPTLNEERNVARVLRKLPSLVDEVIIVDGRSTDRTVEIALSVRPDATIVRETRPGKGAAVRAGFAAATGDLIVMLDGDCSMDPGEIERYLRPLAEGADMVKGSRFLAGGGTADMTRLRKAGNRALLVLVNTLYGCRFSELCYGYMAFRRSRLEQLELHGDGFEIETELVVQGLLAGFRIEEVPSFEEERAYGESNLHTFRDGWRVLRTLLMARLRGRTVGAWGEFDQE
jgi:glycosyltransferase involved in cell wall biosynthesis